MPNRPLPLPQSIDAPIHWGRLHACAKAEAVACSLQQKAFGLIVTANVSQALQWHNALSFFAKKDCPVHLFYDWETLPYDIFSPAQDIIARRLEILSYLNHNPHGILVVAADTLMSRLPPPTFIAKQKQILSVGQDLNVQALCKKLDENGYVRVTQVNDPGEYAIRGSLIDIFTTDFETGVRIDLFGDTIENIRQFNIDTQLSNKKVNSVTLLPAREFSFSQDNIALFRSRFREQVQTPPSDSYIYNDVSEGILPSGIENYLPLFFEKTASLFDYLPADSYTFYDEDIDQSCTRYWKHIQDRYQQSRDNIERPSLPPEQLYLPPSEISNQRALFKQTTISATKKAQQAFVDGGTKPLPLVAWEKDSKQPASKLNKLFEKNKNILAIAETSGYQEQLIDAFNKENIRFKRVNDWHEFCTIDEPLCVCVGSIDEGVIFETDQMSIIAAQQIFNRKITQQRKRKRKNELMIQSLDELEVGCPVVHEKYGVGRYRGLETLEVGGVCSEFVVLHYANEEKLYIPINALNLISRYSGSAETAPLHELGSEQWNKIKRKATQKAFDVAAELLDTQTRRTQTTGIAFKIDQLEYDAFASAFPFEETIDQTTAIADVLDDMQKDYPMDRIICGDVGFGKTEIAMRAAYVAAYNNNQTALLVPTTILAEQHYQSFLERFSDYPVRIEVLSRLLSPSEQKIIQQKVVAGDVDIIISTHKLLNRNFVLQRPGLIIIDEEHRFGVRQKEHLKSAYPHCDILTMTATPIPRTLNMSLSGLRDLSIIATPPPNRLPVKTFISEWSDELIRESCEREIHRGGQVYFLHNNIKTIEEITEKLHSLLPRAQIEFAHGQLPGHVLENIMHRFYHKHLNILVCTTIIESGLDIPNANSIIINEAENLGLSQLHQLRGRVGRSHHRAYAYLLTKVARAYLPPNTVKRLEAIESSEELGVGFTIASQDLEIRGSGELLGKEQSGHIQEVGFNLYHEILKSAINTLKTGEVPDFDKPLNTISEISIGEPAIIPDDYIPDVHLRLVLYRRVASTDSVEALEELEREMIDRFGLMPEYCKHLIINAQLRIRCKSIGINQLKATKMNIALNFISNPPIDLVQLITLTQEDTQQYAFTQDNRLLKRIETDTIEQRTEAIEDLLEKIECLKTA